MLSKAPVAVRQRGLCVFMGRGNARQRASSRFFAPGLCSGRRRVYGGTAGLLVDSRNPNTVGFESDREPVLVMENAKNLHFPGTDTYYNAISIIPS